MLEEIGMLQGKADRESARTVLEAGLAANKQIVEELASLLSYSVQGGILNRKSY